MRLSIELVPRTAGDFGAQLSAVAACAADLVVHGFDTINVPDAPRYTLHPVDACERVALRGWRGIPHLRSMDVPARAFGHLADRIRDARIREVLVIAGDPPKQGRPIAPETTPHRLLRALTQRDRGLRCHAAFDPNRPPDARALANLDAKLEAGARGLFGQPAFTVAAIETWSRVLEPRLPAASIWWGASPVIGDRARQWWERINGIAFPDGFAPTLEDWQARLPGITAAARTTGGNLYLMPIRTPIEATVAPLRSAAVPLPETA
jgi:methylenetetrahydrofolate reductase (NADPH)